MQTIIEKAIAECPVLICYRFLPEAIVSKLPSGMLPKTISGYAVGCVHIVGRRSTRNIMSPTRLAGRQDVVHFLNMTASTENEPSDGFLLLRRDTSSRLHALVGQVHTIRPHHACFSFRKHGDELIDLEVNSDDKLMRVSLTGRITGSQSQNSIFRSPGQAMNSFRHALTTFGRTGVDGVRWGSRNLRLQPLTVEKVASSIFEESEFFPTDCVTFDSAYSVQEFELAGRVRQAERSMRKLNLSTSDS